MSAHLSKDELIQRLYGIESGAGHFETCGECRERYKALEARRAGVAAVPEMSNEFLAAQRRTIYARMGEKPHSGHSWIPALATAALLAAGFFVYQPAPKRAAVPHAEIGDAQLFSEVVLLEQSDEPRAVAPIRALFEEKEQ